MANLIRGLVVGTILGVVIGWLLREQAQERKEKAATEAYINDPEVIAFRKEYDLVRQVDDFVDSLESDDEA